MRKHKFSDYFFLPVIVMLKSKTQITFSSCSFVTAMESANIHSLSESRNIFIKKIKLFLQCVSFELPVVCITFISILKQLTKYNILKCLTEVIVIDRFHPCLYEIKIKKQITGINDYHL